MKPSDPVHSTAGCNRSFLTVGLLVVLVIIGWVLSFTQGGDPTGAGKVKKGRVKLATPAPVSDKDISNEIEGLFGGDKGFKKKADAFHPNVDDHIKHEKLKEGAAQPD